MYVHFAIGDPLKFVVLSNRLKYAANHKLGVLINADVDKVGLAYSVAMGKWQWDMCWQLTN